MVERISYFLPSILIILAIALATFVYFKLINKRLDLKSRNLEWYRQNRWKVSFLVGIPAINVLAPTAEELIFRAPIIVIFSSLTCGAWVGIIVSAVIFAITHWWGNKFSFKEINEAAKGESQAQADDLTTAIKHLEESKAKELKIRRLLHVGVTFILGILFGYFGIKYQSIWLCVGIHAAWNLVMPIVALIVGLIVAIAHGLWCRIWKV